MQIFKKYCLRVTPCFDDMPSVNVPEPPPAHRASEHCELIVRYSDKTPGLHHWVIALTRQVDSLNLTETKLNLTQSCCHIQQKEPKEHEMKNSSAKTRIFECFQSFQGVEGWAKKHAPFGNSQAENVTEYRRDISNRKIFAS
jgi:hypothetical protein